MERYNSNCSDSTCTTTASSGENIQQRPNLEALSSENNKKEQISTKMALYHFSDCSNSGERSVNRDTSENKGSNVANNPNCKSAEKDKSTANLISNINHEMQMYYDKTDDNSLVNTGLSGGPNSEQSFVNNQHKHILEAESLTSADIAPASFYENLTEQLDKNIIMLKKSLDKVLEMRVSMAELKLSLKEISSPELVCKAEELSTQLITLEESHSRVSEMLLSLQGEIRPSVNNDVNKANRDRV